MIQVSETPTVHRGCSEHIGTHTRVKDLVNWAHGSTGIRCPPVSVVGQTEGGILKLDFTSSDVEENEEMFNDERERGGRGGLNGCECHHSCISSFRSV